MFSALAVSRAPTVADWRPVVAKRKRSVRLDARTLGVLALALDARASGHDAAYCESLVSDCLEQIVAAVRKA